jgi:hypothetical protein
MAKNLCYYSTKCRPTQSFLEQLIATPYKSEFSFVCVDPGPNRPRLPQWLKSTPTLLIAGEDRPRTDRDVFNWLFERKMMEGAPKGGNVPTRATEIPMPPRNPGAEMIPVDSRNVLTHVGGTKSITPMPYSPTIDVPPRITPHVVGKGEAPSVPPPAGAGTGPIMDWNIAEMGGNKWSDNYSFIGSADFKSDKGYNPIGRNWEQLTGGSDMPPIVGTGTGAMSAPSSRQSEKEKMLAAQFEAFQREREIGITKAPERR